MSQPVRLARFTALPLATLALTLSACARPVGGGPGASASEVPAGPGTGSVPAAASSPAPRPATSPTGCPDALAVTVRAQAPDARVCLALGGTLRVSAEPSPRQPWQPLSTSDATVLSCASSPGPDGTIDATCRALRPGTATVSTFTAPFPGDPQGPQQYRWQLVVTVVG